MPSEHGIPSDTENTMIPMHALRRLIPSLSIIIDAIASMTETELVSAAKNTRAKNNTPIILPAAICPNTLGSVTNIRPAPLACVPASPLNIYTAGTTIIPARSAIAVSNISIWLTDFTRLTSSLVYEP